MIEDVLQGSVDEFHTSSGVIYELHDDPNRKTDIAEQFEEFSHFMELCVTDPAQAQVLLRDHDIVGSDVMQIMTRYAKEVRRLQVDMRHEREQKVLQIRQRLESELLDFLPSDFSMAALDALVDAAIPHVLGPRNPLLASGTRQSGHLTVNLNPQFVDTVNGIVAQEIGGDITWNENDQKLLTLFAMYANEQQSQLISALRELNDESAPKPGRLSARQKIKSFLVRLGSRAVDVGAGVLQSYIEKKIVGL